jgi:uncharacterized membrane protein
MRRTARNTALDTQSLHFEPSVMTSLIFGLILFLGIHSLRLGGDGLRDQLRQRWGEGAYKGLYSLVSVLGFGLIIWGYGQARLDPVVLWPAMGWTRHLAALLVLVSFVLLVAAYVPGNGIKARLHHPMVLSVKVWAFAHLLANNTLADVLLFGSFLVWAVLAFRSARQRDRAAGTVYPGGSTGKTMLTAVIGLVAYLVFALWLHAAWIGVRPF